MKLPTILCGPILRRAESDCIYIWIALSRNLEIDGQLFMVNSTDSDTFTYTPLNVRTKTTTIKAGEQLYVNLIKISPVENSFPSSVLIGYNLVFRKGSRMRDLGSYGLLSQESSESIVYDQMKFPAFYINDGSAPTRILYGSCRKPHGEGADAFTAADLLLNDTHQNLSNRPGSLFLVGDQIYADDVANPMMVILKSIASVIKGSTDYEPSLGSFLESEELAITADKINGRKFIVKHFAKFTTGHGENHLIRFSEYAAMYLLAWSPELWKYALDNELLLSFREIRDRGMLHLMFEKDEKIKQQEIMKLEKRYEEQFTNLREFIPAVSAARRVMANTPTYMIFDDHDLTDDWNISPDWSAAVNQSPLGSHIQINGLAAYWLFQGFGNDPASFNAEFIKTASKFLLTEDFHSKEYQHGLQLLSTFDSWHFIAPTVPKTVFLDTRTQRVFDIRPKPVKLFNMMEETTRTPFLMSEDSWKQITSKLSESGWTKNSPIMIVSAAPFYGMGLIESFLHKHVFPFKILGIPVQTSFDFDSWKYNGKGFNDFLRRVASWDPSYCILLSGDVHFSSSVHSEVQDEHGEKLNYYQFTCSPINNGSFQGIWGTLMKAVLWLNSYKRKKRTLYRSCDRDYNLKLHKTPIDSGTDHLWKEVIQYKPFQDGSIIETKNAFGYLSIADQKLENTLLMTDDTL